MRRIVSLILCAMLLVMLVAVPVLAVLAKTQNTEVMAWTKLTDTADTAGIKVSSEFDCSASYSANLHIYACLAETTAHDGCEVIVQVASIATTNDAWTEYRRFIMASGTAFKSDFGANEAAGQTELSITNPATGNADHDGKFVFIYPADDPNIANCEIAYQVDNSGDAGDTITVLEGITNAQTVDTDLLTCDGTASAVSMVVVGLPMSASRARVIFNNSLDTSGSNVIVRVRGTKVTGI